MGAREELTASIPNLIGRVPIQIFPSYDRLVKRFPLLAFSLRTGLLVLIFILLEKFLFNFLKLSVEGYSEPSLSLSAIEKIGPAGLLLILLVSVPAPIPDPS